VAAGRRPRGGGLRLTKVGLGFLALAFVLLLAAVNTGNNGLYLALAVMGAMVLISQLAGAANVRRLRLALQPPAEIFANRPSHLTVEVENRGWAPRWLLLLTVAGDGFAHRLRRTPPLLVARLGRRQRHRGHLELLARRRGRLTLQGIEASSLFPLGFFDKVARYPLELELLIYPELFAPPSSQPGRTARSGDRPTHRRGWGHDLLGLRAFRPGDDPRAIHWKQSARTGNLIVKEREREESRRLQIVFDNAAGELADEAERQRFERLVSEAATAAVDVLARGWEVELLTRDLILPFASGPRQRQQVLEALALIEPRPRAERPLVARGDEPHLRLVMDGGGRQEVE